MDKKIVIKNKEVFEKQGFSVIVDKEYPVIFDDGIIIFAKDENERRIGVANMANPSIVEIRDSEGNVINEPFVDGAQ